MLACASSKNTESRSKSERYSDTATCTGLLNKTRTVNKMAAALNQQKPEMDLCLKFLGLFLVFGSEVFLPVMFRKCRQAFLVQGPAKGRVFKGVRMGLCPLIGPPCLMSP